MPLLMLHTTDTVKRKGISRYKSLDDKESLCNKPIMILNNYAPMKMTSHFILMECTFPFLYYSSWLSEDSYGNTSCTRSCKLFFFPLYKAHKMYKKVMPVCPTTFFICEWILIKFGTVGPCQKLHEFNFGLSQSTT
jgi:hypothetical protein